MTNIGVKMTVDELIWELQELSASGIGEAEIHVSSGLIGGEARLIAVYNLTTGGTEEIAIMPESQDFWEKSAPCYRRHMEAS